MAYPRIYACAVGSTMQSSDELPSPTDVTTSDEQIWSKDTGRAQSGNNIAQMVGKSVAEKKTYSIKWDILATDGNSTASAKLSSITSKLTKGFFKFGYAENGTVPSGIECYRSEITYAVGQAGGDTYYKGVSVQVIER